MKLRKYNRPKPILVTVILLFLLISLNLYLVFPFQARHSLARVDRRIEILDPWAGSRTDNDTGSDAHPSHSTRPNHLGDDDDSSQVILDVTDNGVDADEIQLAEQDTCDDTSVCSFYIH